LEGSDNPAIERASRVPSNLRGLKLEDVAVIVT
jgi:hypothetical protein